jgi:hypothetical protein
MPLVMMKIKSKKVDRSSYWQGVVEETVSYEVQPLGEVELDEPLPDTPSKPIVGEATAS